MEQHLTPMKETFFTGVPLQSESYRIYPQKTYAWAVEKCDCSIRVVDSLIRVFQSDLYKEQLDPPLACATLHTQCGKLLTVYSLNFGVKA